LAQEKKRLEEGDSRRTEAMGEAIRHLAGQQREKLVVVLQPNSRFGLRLEPKIESWLRRRTGAGCHKKIATRATLFRLRASKLEQEEDEPFE
jgi:hypothetical protein